jgi:hypothetical protein
LATKGPDSGEIQPILIGPFVWACKAEGLNIRPTEMTLTAPMITNAVHSPFFMVSSSSFPLSCQNILTYNAKNPFNNQNLLKMSPPFFRLVPFKKDW